MLTSSSKNAWRLNYKVGHFFLLIIEQTSAVWSILLLLFLLLPLFLLLRPIIACFSGLLKMSLDQAEVEVNEWGSAKFFREKLQEIFCEVFDNKLLFNELSTNALSPPITNFLHFWSEI